MTLVPKLQAYVTLDWGTDSMDSPQPQKLLLIIPLRPYLEKIEGCQRLDIFRIRQWVHQIRIISDSDRALNVDAHVSPRFFFLHALLRSSTFRTTEVHLSVLFLLFLCVYFQCICIIKSCYFAIKSSCKIFRGIYNDLRGYCTSYQKLACLVLYLKIINTFLKNNKCIL